uniref:EGF-like domain-containing protein n=1 Tax=Anopheles funestus TaxID=62324 RepID=A0A182S3R4_ANOFN
MQRYIWSLFLLLQLSLASAKHYYDVAGERSVTYELVCPENEELRHTLPCCEPTCSNDCTTAKCPKTCVRQPTCVCKEGYVRHKGKCILLRHCPPKPPSPLTCGENEELLPSPPSCEPTCTEDCAGRPIHTRYVDQPTCVCKKGYRRHKGKCIRVDQCPSCGPYATLKASAPCCEPSCDNDCSNVLCIESFQSEEPVCVCQDGYVKHNSTCIKRELCPQTAYPAPFTYCRSGVKRKPSGRVPVPVKYVEVNNASPCSCYQPLVNDGRPSDYYPSATYSPRSYPAMNYAMPTTTCAPPAKPATYLAEPYSPPRYQPLNYSPSQYMPGPYVPPPAFAPSVYAQPPTTTVSPPQYMPGAYVPPPPCAPSVYAQPTTTTVAPPQYMPGPYVPSSACPPSPVLRRYTYNRRRQALPLANICQVLTYLHQPVLHRYTYNRRRQPLPLANICQVLTYLHQPVLHRYTYNRRRQPVLHQLHLQTTTLCNQSITILETTFLLHLLHHTPIHQRQ